MQDFVLQTKLHPPQLKGKILRRARLLNLLKENLDKKLILICADAGYGKTTLLTQLCEELDKPYVFYDLDSSDNDIATFFNYLVSGMQRYYPDFGKSTRGVLPQTRNIEIIVGTFINEFWEHFPCRTSQNGDSSAAPQNDKREDFYIILDDYHHLQQNKEIGNALDYLLRHIPSNLHLIISSRSTPSLNLAYYLAKQELFRIEKDHLQFNIKEIQELLIEQFGLKVPDSEIERIEKHSEGWITAIQLILQKISVIGEDKAKETLNGYIASGEEIFNYFAREVFDSQPKEIQEFLMKTSILEYLSPATCNYILTIQKSSSILSYLESEHIFLSKITPETYKYHSLFKEFLYYRLKTVIDKDSFVSLNRKIAGYYYKIGKFNYAAKYFLNVMDYKRAAKILAEEYQLTPSNYGFYLSLINSIPEPVLYEYPNALFKKATILISRGFFKEGLKILTYVKSILQKKKDVRSLANVLKTMAYTYLCLCEPRRGLVCIKRASKLTLPDEKEMKVKILITSADLYKYLGHYEEAERYLREAEKLAISLMNSLLEIEVLSSLARLYGSRCDFERAWTVYETILEKPANIFNPLQYINISSNAAAILLELYELEKAENLLYNAYSSALQFNDHRGLAYTMGIYGRLFFYKKNFEEAIHYYSEALNMGQKLGEKMLQLYSVIDLVVLYLSTNRIGDAKRLLNNFNESIIYGIPEPVMIDYLIIKGRVEKNEMFFKEALLSAQKLKNPYIEMKVCYYYGDFLRLKGRKSSAIEFLNNFLKVVVRNGYRYFLKRIIIVEGIESTNFCLENNLFKDFIIDIMNEIKNETINKPIAKKEITHSEFYLKVNLFGKIEVFDNNGVKCDIIWKTKKSRALFVYFLINPQKIFTRDQIIETFWPNTNLRRAIHNLHTNLTFVRQTLSGLLKLSAHFIKYSAFGYQLNPEFCIESDIQNFKNLLFEARRVETIDREKSIKLYEEALTLFKGEFCPEIYENWAEEMRSYYNNAANKVANEIAYYYLTRKDYIKAIEYYKRAVEIDPTDEDGYIGLMQCFGALDNKKEVILTYQKVKEVLKTRLNLNPSPNVDKTYREVIAQF